MMSAVLLVMGLAACGGSNTYPFKEISELYTEYENMPKNNGQYNEQHVNQMVEFIKKVESWCMNAKGEKIKAEVDSDLGMELVNPYGMINFVHPSGTYNEKVNIGIYFDIKIKDIDVVNENRQYMAVVENDEGEVVIADDIIWRNGDEKVYFGEKKVKDGDTVKGSVYFEIRSPIAESFKNASKIVIRRHDDRIRMGN